MNKEWSLDLESADELVRLLVGGLSALLQLPLSSQQIRVTVSCKAGFPANPAVAGDFLLDPLH